MSAVGRSLGGLAAALVALATLAAAPESDAPGGLVLERIVVVARHGVRSPTKTAAWLSNYSAQAWPDWAVPPGELTPHGAKDVRLMGAWLRADYARQGLWPAAGCPGANDTYAWADGADQRTRVSGDALLDGAFPGCGLTAHHGPAGAVDPIFDSVATGACPMDAEMAKAAVLARVRGDLDHPAPGYEVGKAAFWRVLDPAGAGKSCAPDAGGACFLGGNNTLVAKKGDLKLDGPLGTASTLTESLYLEYAQGMAREQVGWGRAGTPDRLAGVMGLHTIETDLMRRTPYLASHNTARLAQAVVDAVDGRPGLPEQRAAGAKLAVIAGHDTNLSNLAGMLGLDWTLKDQPDNTPPDGALVFEVWRAPATGARYVRVRFVYQTLDQLRDEASLDAGHRPGQLSLRLPNCGGGPGATCPASDFAARVRAAIPAECRR